MVEVRLIETQVNTGSADQNGCLAFADGKLVAVLVELSGEEHGEQRGKWFCEAAFGPCKPAESDMMIFPSLDKAKSWFERQPL